jgi:hypothetical protein
MNQPHAQRIHDLFLDAIELPDALRGHFLERACGDDPELRVAVEELLDAHGRAGDFLADPTIRIGDLIKAFAVLCRRRRRGQRGARPTIALKSGGRFEVASAKDLAAGLQR